MGPVLTEFAPRSCQSESKEEARHEIGPDVQHYRHSYARGKGLF
jgi:hypothetical protein